ncbi:FecCD family ABC transporter permease [Marinilactibacillus piezotolerans]|uniref:FecCD family ABC transporter permease n=1 Tax=Marinilactibacillus piezotolerans TaxID=258723 RepID=UPI0009B15D06|nr:iron ABC transporter permease [Marinilactibacillus piezotolerans]
MEQIRKRQLNKKETKKRILQRFKSKSALTYFLIVLVLLFGTMFVSISYGAAEITWSVILEALLNFDETRTQHLILYDLRFPRVAAAALVGAFLAVSGVIMQGLTRNPLASPSIMGVSSGAGFMVAVAFALFPGTSQLGLVFWAFTGAGIGAAMVFSIGLLSNRGLTPVKLALAGAAVSALLQSASTMLALYFNVSRDISFWYAGGVAGISAQHVHLAAVTALIGLTAAVLLSRSLTLMSLGDEVAKGLGQRTTLVKAIGILVVLLLTGTAVSISGTIGFIGLVIPHVTKRLIGMDYRWIIPFSAVFGAWLLVLADIAARAVNPPYELPVGAFTALIGVPFFLTLARRDGRGWK